MLSEYRVYRYDHLESPAVTAGSAAVLIGAQNGLFHVRRGDGFEFKNRAAAQNGVENIKKGIFRR